MPISTITLYSGVVPNRATQSPEDFTNAAITWTDYQAVTLIPSINITVGEINAAVTQVDSDKTSAAASAASAAQSAASAAASSDFKGLWSSLTGALNKPASVYHNGGFWALLNNLADVTASEPGVSADWLFISGTLWSDRITASATLNTNQYASVLATSAPVDLTQPTFAANDFLVVQNSPLSTETVKILNPSNTIIGSADTAAPGDNVVLLPGDTVYIKANSATELEIVNG